VIFLNDNTTGDGVMTALQVLRIMAESGSELSALADQMQRLPQVLVNVKCANDKKNLYRENAEIMQRIADIENRLEGCGRVLVRPSGTEALVRVMLEGPDQETITGYANELADLMKSLMN
jgi:phosphoglucosamine mutase